MAIDTIFSGVRVITRRGGIKGSVIGMIRHAVTRAVVAVVINPGTGDAEDYIITSARNLKAA